MDQLEVSIAHEDSPASNDGVSVFVEVKMNGVLLPDILGIAEFFEVIKGNGIFPLFTCSCGLELSSSLFS